MQIERRHFLALTAAVIGNKYCPRLEAQPRPSPLPDKTRFQSGDFLWPKRPGAYVPYDSGNAAERAIDEARWTTERDVCVAALRREPRHFTAFDIEKLGSLTYAEFFARYAVGAEPGVPLPFGADSTISVGHVGIVEIDPLGQRWIIEALLHRGVVRQPYENWLEGRPDEVVWHGRIRHSHEAQLARVAAEAKSFIGRPYDFWNFDLSDAAGFYCSKLVWLSAYKALGSAVDGNMNPKRIIWFSPKQLMNAESVLVLQSPATF